MEIWKDIEGYEGLYQVSNLGRVKSVLSKKILKQYEDSSHYKRVRFYKDGKHKDYSVHRLVATAFIPNPDKLPCVNHKSEIVSENFADNLEWCSNKYNSNYGTTQARRVQKRQKPILQYDLNGEFIREWNSVKEAGEYLNISPRRISEVCNYVRKSCGGYIFELKNKNDISQKFHNSMINNKKLSKTILQFDLNEKFIKEWPSLQEIQRKTNYSYSNVISCCRGKYKQAYGFIWRYKETAA